MNINKLLIFIFLKLNLIGQIELKFLDESNSKPIYFVQLFDLKGELLGISNLNGEVSFGDIKDSIIIAKHLDYKTLKFDCKTKKTFLLEPLVQNLDEVKVAPKNVKNLLKTVLTNSKNKIPSENFYGKLHFHGAMYELSFDSISRKINDSIIKYIDGDIHFQYLYNTKTKSRKIYVLPENIDFKFASLINSKNGSNNFHKLYNYFLDCDFLFDKDFNSDFYQGFDNRKRYAVRQKSNDEKTLEIKDLKGQDKLMYNVRIEFDENDSTILQFEALNQKIIDNSIGREIQEFILYDTINNVFYPKKAIYNFYYKNGVCEEINVGVSEVYIGISPKLNELENFNLKRYCNELKPNFIAFEYGKFPKRFYQLFKE